MSITQDDIRLYASERMTDYADGGGRMSPNVIVDGADNNVFPDITDLERLGGRTSLRKVFGAAVNPDNDTFLSAHALLDDAPDDAATDAVIFNTGALTTERAEAQAMIESWHRVPTSTTRVISGGVGQSVIMYEVPLGAGDTYLPLVGEAIGLVNYSDGADPPAIERVVVTGVDSATLYGGGAGGRYRREISIDRPLTRNYAPATGWDVISTSDDYALRNITLDEVRPFGVTTSAAGAAAAATTIAVAELDAQIVPYVSGTYPTEAEGIDPLPFEYCDGKVAFLRAKDLVLLHHTVAEAPDTVANSDVVNVGRTTLARLRVIGNNGVEHARFVRGVPAPSGVGCTADLDAGTVTFTDVSGMSQPVTVEHRIEEMSKVSSIATLTLTLNRPLARAFPAGTKVSSLVQLGDLQGRVEAGFAQQAWTGAWSDARIGGEPTADYNDVVNPLTTTNEGAVSQRWAVIFTNTTNFRVIGEFLGEVGIGNTGTNCTPNNPSTSAPYFTIPAAGWGSGWSAGNVYRFNTVGAQAPIWALRCVSPSLPGGDDSVTVEFRGYVNA